MSQHIASQPAPVVLRSRYVQLRAFLAAALIAVVSLTATVVVLATDDDVTRLSTPRTAPAPVAVPSTPGLRYDGGPEEGTRGPLTVPLKPGTRYDGGPEEGTRGPLTAPLKPGTRYDGGPEEGTRGLQSVPVHPDLRYDGGPEEGTSGPGR